MKLGLWQTVGFPGDVPANLAALEQTARGAAEAGAALLLCPECWVCGYNIGSAGIASLAETCDGPSASRIADIARRNSLAIAYGYAERDPSGRIYNSVQVLGADGTPLSNYRKTHLFGPDERSAYTPGSGFADPFPLGELRFGLLICYDVEFPEPVRCLSLLGADAILIPTALSEEYPIVPQTIVPARAVENQVPIAYCNHTGVENGMRFLGGSCLTGTDGKTLASAGTEDALIIGEISKAAVRSTATMFPYRGDRRPELYGHLTSSDVQR
jgi:predicted amidohydrolase